MNNLIIRQATQSDLQAIFDLVKDLAVYEKAEQDVKTTLEGYQKSFAQGDFEALVAQVNDQVIGMALYYTAFSTWKGRMLYLEDFVVQSHFRGRGVGNKLFEAFIAMAKKKSCKMIKWQVLDWNTPALNFYQKYKATIEKEWWNGKIIFD